MDKELCKELRKINIEIEEYRKINPDSEQMDAQIVDAIYMVIRMAKICKKEGLLGLEDESWKIGETVPCRDLLKQIVMLIVDGTDPEMVQEYAVARYYALNLHTYEALAAMIYIEFSRNLQKGMHPLMTERMILSLVPASVEKKYLTFLEQKEKEKHEKVDKTVVDKVCADSHDWTMDEEGYYLVKFLEIIINTIDERSIQKIMMEVDSSTLTKVMSGFGEEAKQKIFGCASDRFAVMLAEEMNSRGEVSPAEVAKEVKIILAVMRKMMREGKIPNTGIEFFDKM